MPFLRHPVKVLDEAVVAMGFKSLWTKFKLPTWFMMLLAHVVVVVGDVWAALTGTPKHIINYTLKLNPFAVKMLVINRYLLPILGLFPRKLFVLSPVKTFSFSF
jgi:hypothetical protein